MKHVEGGRMRTLPDAPAGTLEERVRRLEDAASIREILYHYTRAVDRGDFEGIGSCYLEEGCFLAGDGAEPIRGRGRILEVFGRLMDPEVKTSAHMIANQQIHFVTGDEALVFAYFSANKSFRSQREDELTWGGYELRVVRDTDGEWRIKTHKVFMTRQDGSRTGRCEEQRNRPWPPVPEYRA